MTKALTNGWQRERFDYVANNAGVGLNASIEEMTEDRFDLLVNIRLKPLSS